MLKAYFKAENLKNKHTVSAKLFWIVPLLSIGIAIAFSGQDSRYYQMNQMNWWYTTFFPMFLLLASAFCVQREKKVKNRVMSALPVNMRKIWAVKVMWILISMICAVGIIFFAQEVISRFFAAGGSREISTLAAFFAAVLWIILSAWQIPVWLFVNERLGFAAGIILGLAANIGLGILGALSAWWIWNPFSYVSRVMCPVLGILPNGLPAKPGNMTYFDGVLDPAVIPMSVAGAGIVFVLCMLLTTVWYQRKGERGWEN